MSLNNVTMSYVFEIQIIVHYILYMYIALSIRIVSDSLKEHNNLCGKKLLLI